MTMERKEQLKATIAKNIYHLMDERSITKFEGVTDNELSLILQKKRMPSIMQLEDIALQLDVSICQLIEEPCKSHCKCVQNETDPSPTPIQVAEKIVSSAHNEPSVKETVYNDFEIEIDGRDFQIIQAYLMKRDKIAEHTVKETLMYISVKELYKLLLVAKKKLAKKAKKNEPKKDKKKK